jgi:uncharacterized protein (DUF58 family)
MLRRLQFVLLAGLLFVAAFSTGAIFLFFLLYLGIVVIGGAYVVTRFGLSDLEAGHVLDRLRGEVGDVLRASYTVRNLSRIPKLWLEVHNPTTLPVPLPGRALALGSRSEVSWVTYAQLTRRGQYRIEPLLLRAADPFGLFESYATVGRASTVIVYPHVEPIPGWHLAPAAVEGSHAHPVRTPQTTPHATSIRPYAPGDAYNRIHWKSSARQGELQVKEFDLEQTADVWLFLDLYGPAHAGEGDESTVEYAVRAAAAIGAQAIYDNRAVAMTASGARVVTLQPDRGQRQYQKIMQLLAAANADGSQPLQEVLVENILRLRRGTTAIILTPSTDREWVKPLSTLTPRGVAVMVVALDAAAFAAMAPAAPETSAQPATPPAAPPTPPTKRELPAQRALLHALAEYDMSPTWVGPGRSLAEQLVTRGPRVLLPR